MAVDRGLFVLRDGRVEPLPADAPVLRADDLGVLRGEGVFETFRVAARRAIALDAHLERFASSAAAVRVPVPEAADLHRLVTTAVAGWAPADGVLRLVATKGGGPGGGPGACYALVTAIPPAAVEARRGVAVVTLDLGVSATVRRGAPWLLGGVKATSYAVAMAAQRAAEAAGADDAIWVSSDGELLEGTTSTLVLALPDGLCTPPAEEVGVLTGTTLDLLRGLVPVTERRLVRADLAASDDVLLVSSIRGVAPVVLLDGVPRTLGRHGRELPERLEELLQSAADL